MDVRRSLGCGLLAIAALGSAPAAARASFASDTSTVLVLDSVTVTAARGVSRIPTTSSVTVLRSGDLARSASPALDDVLRMTPGFGLFRRSTSRTANPTTQGVTLRGLSASGASRTLVLADGVPLNDPFGGWVSWDRVPLAAIERVEVVRGALGDLYGADALGGVIQVLTPAPGDVRTQASADLASHATGRASFTAGMRHGAWSASVAAEGETGDGALAIAPESRGLVDVPAFRRYATSALAVAHDRGASHGGLRLIAQREERGNGTRLQENSVTWLQASADASGGFAGGAWSALASLGDERYFQTFSAATADRDSERLTLEQRVPSRAARGSAQWSRTFGRSALRVGVDGFRVNADLEETRWNGGAGTVSPAARGRDLGGGVFTRVTISPWGRLVLVAGARGDLRRSETSTRDETRHDFRFLSPRLGATWNVAKGFSLAGSWSRAHRAPTLNERIRGFRAGDVVTLANPALGPERLDATEAIARWETHAAVVRATGFWNRLDGAVTSVTTSVAPTLIMRERRNAGRIRARGVEVEAETRPWRAMAALAFAGWTDSRFQGGDTPASLEGRRVPQVPDYQIGTSLVIGDNVRGMVTTQVRWVGRQYDDDLNQFVLAPATVVDVSVSRPLRSGFTLSVFGENLFDREVDVGRTPLRTVGWPRTFRVSLRWLRP